jgi:hypothetical protein
VSVIKSAYPIVAIKTCSLELEDEKRISPKAKTAVKAVISFSTRPLELTWAKMTIATVGSRHATTVMTINVKRRIPDPEK